MYICTHVFHSSWARLWAQLIGPKSVPYGLSSWAPHVVVIVFARQDAVRLQGCDGSSFLCLCFVNRKIKISTITKRN